MTGNMALMVTVNRQLGNKLKMSNFSASKKYPLKCFIFIICVL